MFPALAFKDGLSEVVFFVCQYLCCQGWRISVKVLFLSFQNGSIFVLRNLHFNVSLEKVIYLFFLFLIPTTILDWKSLCRKVN